MGGRLAEVTVENTLGLSCHRLGELFERFFFAPLLILFVIFGRDSLEMAIHFHNWKSSG